MRIHRLPFILLATALLLAACGQGAVAPAETATPPPATPTDAPPPTQAPTEPMAETEAPTARPEPTAEGLGPIPQGPSQLRASNPSNVDLAAGKPTLVEFFAFW